MGADAAVARLVVRETRRGAIGTAAAVSVMTAMILSTYDAANLSSLTSDSGLVNNPAIRAIYGPAYGIETAPGFAVWRAGTFVLVICGLWGLLATTRVLRGDEEAGRWELMLAEPLDRTRTLVMHLVVLIGACVVSGIAVTATYLATGAPATGSILFGVGVFAFMALFVAIAALTSQLFGQRGRASGVAGAALGVAFVVRMLADAAQGLQWVRWLTPFGWVESLQAFAGDHTAALVPLLVSPVVLLGLAVVLVHRRDLGDGVLPSSDRARARTRLLGSPTAFAWRTGSGALVGWSIGLAFYGLIIGAVANAFTDFISSNADMQRFINQFGLGDLARPDGLLSTMDAMVAVALCLYAVSCLRRTQEDETQDRLEAVLAQPTTRTRWLGGIVVATAAAVLITAAINAAGTWTGAALGAADIGVGSVVTGLVNYLPVVALFFGLTLLLHGTAPGTAVPTASSLVIGSFLLALFGPALNWPEWLVTVSPFDHVSKAPVAPIDLVASLVMLGAAAAFGVAGFVAYQRRDLA